MPKLLQTLLFTFLLIAFHSSFITPVYADDQRVTVEINYGADNKAWATPGRKITVTLKSVGKDPMFSPFAPYTYRFNNVIGNEVNCPKDTINAPAGSTQPLVIEKVIGENDCSTQLGEWVFNLWAGTDAGDSSNAIIQDYQFHLDQDGGGEPILSSAYAGGIVPYNERPIVTLSNIKRANDYTFWWENGEGLAEGLLKTAMSGGVVKGSQLPGGGDVSVFNITMDKINNEAGTIHRLCMEVGDFGGVRQDVLTCHYFVDFIYGQNPAIKNPTCVISNPTPSIEDVMGMTVFNPSTPGTNSYTIGITGPNISTESEPFQTTSPFIFDITFLFRRDSKPMVTGKYTASAINNGSTICSTEFNVQAPGSPPGGSGRTSTKSLTCNRDTCTQAVGTTCDPTSGEDGKPGGVQTAIGCIPTNPTLLIQSLLKFGAGVGGGLAFLMMIYASFLMITSAGNPDNLKKAHDQFINAIIGLLFIIFAVMLLKVIGVDILQIPGFQ